MSTCLKLTKRVAWQRLSTVVRTSRTRSSAEVVSKLIPACSYCRPNATACPTTADEVSETSGCGNPTTGRGEGGDGNAQDPKRHSMQRLKVPFSYQWVASEGKETLGKKYEKV
jgi:hypothetical protein